MAKKDRVFLPVSVLPLLIIVAGYANGYKHSPIYQA